MFLKSLGVKSIIKMVKKQTNLIIELFYGELNKKGCPFKTASLKNYGKLII